MKRRPLLLAILKGLWVWGLISWLWVAAVVLDPVTTQSQFDQLSLYVPIPTDLFGVAAFVIAFFAFILWEWQRQP